MSQRLSALTSGDATATPRVGFFGHPKFFRLSRPAVLSSRCNARLDEHPQ